MYISGIIPDRVKTSSEGPEFALGTIGFNTTSSGPKGYIYVQDSGSGITGAGYVALVDGSAFTAVMATTTTTAPGTGAGMLAGTALAAIAASGYGWLQIYGAGTAYVNAACAKFTVLNATATAGEIDDDATAGAEVIDGIVLTATAGGSAAATACFHDWPKVGRTL